MGLPKSSRRGLAIFYNNTPCPMHLDRCICLLATKVGPGTLKFKTVPLEITEEVENQAKHALCPSSPVMSGEEADIFSKGGYLSLQGKIMELRGVRMTHTNVPVLDIQLQCGGKLFEVSLWRDEALTDIYVGDEVVITHLHPCIIHNGRGKFHSSP